MAARVGAQAGHDARLLVVAHALLKKVGLAPAQHAGSTSASDMTHISTCLLISAHHSADN